MSSPTRIGCYAIESEIGHGGMGVVYRAADTRLGRSVAIKVLPAQFADDPESLMRFEREARALAALNHPNVATIHGIEVHENISHLVLEYVDGETLAERVARGPLRIGEVLAIGSQIAAALEAAHDAGLIHRDLKPANVKVSSSGTVKVLDFGLARLESASEPEGQLAEAPTVSMPDAVTTPGTILGTVQYMSPEQARGGNVDRRADLWALGVVLYECLTGRNPLARESAAETLAAIYGEDVDLTLLPENTPSEVVSLIGRCLRRDIRQRQRDAGDCRLILEDARKTLAQERPQVARISSTTNRQFRITDELCRTLDRNGFDGLLPGWEMRFADNNRDSEVLILWIPSIGGDHTTTAWRELIAASPHRMVIVCPVGMEPGVENRPVVSIETQFALIRALTRELRSQLNPTKTVMSGFSCGSIMALRCAAGDDGNRLFDGVLAIDPDMQESDCFITRLFAGLDTSSANDVLSGLHRLSGSCGSMAEWLVLHQHMIECVDKVKDDLSPLIRQGEDLSAPFNGVHTGEASPFVDFLRGAMEQVGTVRCVFHDSAENRRMLGEIRMMHLDRQCLGRGFTDEALSFIPVNDHIDMMNTDRLLDLLDGIVNAVTSESKGRR